MHIEIDPIRSYFGEKIALYFTFLKFYTRSLLYMWIIGVIVTIILNDATANNNVKTYNSIQILFAIIIVVWSTGFIEFWKRE